MTDDTALAEAYDAGFRDGREACIEAAATPANPAGLREAAQEVIAKAEPDEGDEGFIDYLVPAPALERLRLALRRASDDR